jgi:hypothetical protein
VSEIKSISKAEVLSFYDTYISAVSDHRRKIACHVISTLEENGNSPGRASPDVLNGNDEPKPEINGNGIAPTENGVCEKEKEATNEVIEEPVLTGPEPVLIEDVVAFKNSHCLWPLGKPYRDPKTLVRADIANSA